MRTVVFDIETMPQQGATVFDPATQDITVVGVYDSARDAYECFEVEELPQLWQLLEQTDVLVGYNSLHFDTPVLNRYYPGDLMHIKQVDLLKTIVDALGRRLRLDTVAEGTLGTKKSGHGLDAQRWWAQGEKDRVKEYCLKDVEITKRIFDYALEHGSIKYKELGATKDIAIDTSEWQKNEGSAITRTLGF